MVCQYLEEIYDLYVLGILDEEACAAIREHVESGCSRCVESLREAAAMVYFLSQTIRPARPEPRWKHRLLRRLRAK